MGPVWKCCSEKDRSGDILNPRNDAEFFDIAITSNTLSAGGAEKQRVLLANELVRLGHRVSLYCLQDLGELRPLLSSSVSLRQRPFWKGPLYAHDFIVSGTTNTEIAFSWIGRLRFVRPAMKWLLAIHNPMGPDAPRLKKFSKFGLRFADVLLALDKPHADAVLQYWDIDVDGCVPNGLDLTWADQVKAIRERTSKFEFDVGFIGRISEHHKGLDLLLEAMSAPAAKALKLAIAGSGPDAEALKVRAQELGISPRISWLGHQDTASFLTRVAGLALFSRYEGQPLVLLEAQAAGVPVVASPTSSALASERVAVVNTFNRDEAAAALRRVCEQAPPVFSDSKPDTVAEMTGKYLQLMADVPDLRRKPWTTYGARNASRTANRAQALD